MRRALALVALGAALATAVHCGSFSSSTPAPAPSPDAAADGPLDALSNDASALPGCAGRVTPTGFCADFEDGLLVAWRDAQKETLWKLKGEPSELMLLPSERPEGGSSLSATAKGTGERAHLEYRAPAMRGVSLAFDVRTDTLPASASGMTVLQLEFAKASIAFRVSGSGERLVLDADGAQQLAESFAPGYPPLLGNWRTVTIELGGSGNTRRLLARVDGFEVIDLTAAVQLADFSAPLPVSLFIGAVESNEAGYVVRLDNVRLTELP